MKMKWSLLILTVALFGAGFLFISRGDAAPEASGVEAEPKVEAEKRESSRFPIVTRLDIARAYGYFVGDEIPLTLEIETEQNVVLDLVNLPREGEEHGSFEVRTFNLTTIDQPDARRLYRAEYRLQYFGAAPLSLQFDPLEILYASPQNRDEASQRYIYKSLFTQPMTIDISRIGPYRPTPALAPKGPLEDPRSWNIWIAGVLGGLCILLSVGGGGRECWAAYQQRRGLLNRSAAAHTLERLRQEDDVLAPVEPSEAAAVSALGGIVREYLNNEWGVSAYTLTPAELAARLEGTTPQVQDVLALLQECDTLKYQRGSQGHDEEHVLWDEAVALFEQLEER